MLQLCWYHLTADQLNWFCYSLALPCARCFIWLLRALYGIGTPAARTGICFSVSWKSCSRNAQLTDSLPLLFPTGRWERGRQGMPVELRHQLSTILDFVELRIHKIFWSTQMLRTIGQLTLERDFLQDCFRAAGRPIPKLSSDDQ